MALVTLKGDLLDALANKNVTHVGHVVNCRGIMGVGIAKQIKERYSWAYKSYFDLWKDYSFAGNESRLLGFAQSTGDLQEGVCIWNLHAQLSTGTHRRQLNYGALGECLFKMSDETSCNTDIIGFPYGMGCGFAGGDWNIVLEMIVHYFKDHNVKIYKM